MVRLIILNIDCRRCLKVGVKFTLFTLSPSLLAQSDLPHMLQSDVLLNQRESGLGQYEPPVALPNHSVRYAVCLYLYPLGWHTLPSHANAAACLTGWPNAQPQGRD